MSSGAAAHRDVGRILLANIPGAAKVEKAQMADDKTGIDYWVYRDAVEPLSVDVKVREQDPIVKYGQDDLVLETLSVVETGKVGWTLDSHKRADYILWLFEPTGRWVLVPFPMLCAVMTEHQQEWTTLYQRPPQSSDGGRWHSQALFVPRREVWAAIYRRYSGVPLKQGA